MAIKKSELYSSLWKSCDELRGGMDASQYKDYVLTFLFMKYVSDKYAGDKYGMITVPEGGSFADMAALKGNKEIGDQINKIIGRLAEENDLKGVIDVADFNDEEKLGKGKDMVDRLSKLVAIFDGMDLSANRAEGDDLLGDAYEYLMRHFATESGKSKGQFYTPAEVSRILSKVVGITKTTPQDMTIYDPTCGSGSLLLKASDEAPRGLTICGQENDVATAALARMNMILHDNATAEIWKDNTLSAPHWKNKEGGLQTFDFSVANPPFSYKSWSNGLDVNNDEFGRFEYGTPPDKNGDYAFLLHILKSLKSTGKGAVILPHGVLFRGNTEASIRRNLIRQGYIKGIIGLPANLFYGTGIYRKMLAGYFEEAEDKALYKVEEFERQVKQRFVKEPGQMRLLIVVDKLLTGFDAPSATYLYIDKQMRDHGLFQAICRVNRLDGEDKEYGYVIDYKDLFHHLEGAVDDYTSGALDGYDKEDVAGLLSNRLDKAKEKMGEALEVIRALCEPVLAPKNTADYLHYFCAADTIDKDALRDNEPKRVALYKAVASLARAYANLANEMTEAGYSKEEAGAVKDEVEHYTQVREQVKLASGDYLDMKRFEPAMRHLLDTYIRAEDSEVVADFGDLGIIELIVKNGLRELDKLPKSIRGHEGLVAETIENNIRKVIIDEQAVNPKYYEQMSEVLNALIEERRTGALEYQNYLEKMKALASQVVQPEGEGSMQYPRTLNTRAKRSLFDNLDRDEALAVLIDEVVRTTKKANWIGHRFKEKEVANAVRDALPKPYHTRLDDIMELLRNQGEYQ